MPHTFFVFTQGFGMPAQLPKCTLLTRSVIASSASGHAYRKLLIFYSLIQSMKSSDQYRSSYQTFPSQVEIINSEAGQVRLERPVCIFIQPKTRAAH